MYFNEEDEIIEMVRRFEACEIHPEEFRHYQHLTVALWYIREFPFEIASEKMRAGIQRLAAAYGKMGYHETITRFWLRLVRDFAAADEAPAAEICDLANRLVTSCSGKNLINEYYSSELLATSEARERWVEPDLKCLPQTTSLRAT